MKKVRNFKTRIICYPKDDMFIGVALDFDLIVQGKSLTEASHRIMECICGYLEACIKDNDPDEEIYRKSNKKYFQVYNLIKKEGKSKNPNSKKINKYNPNILSDVSLRGNELAYV